MAGNTGVYMRAEAIMAYLVPYEQASFMLSLQIVSFAALLIIQFSICDFVSISITPFVSRAKPVQAAYQQAVK